jgi:hypothetical protein
MLPELRDQIPSDQDIASVTAGGAYTRKCHDAVAARVLRPSFRCARTPDPGRIPRPVRSPLPSAQRRTRLAPERVLPHHHRAPRLDHLATMERPSPPKPRRTKMHCVRPRGQSLTARDVDRQVAAFHLRVALMNGYTALGIPVTEAVG